MRDSDVAMNRFLNSSASSMKSASTPSSSNVTTLSFFSAANIRSNLALIRSRAFSISLIMLYLPRSAPRLKIASVVSSICSKSSISSVSDGIPIFLKLECPMTTASQSPVAMHPNSFCRFSLAKSVFSAINVLRLDTVCKYLLSIEVINGWGRQTWVSGLGPCACFLVRLQYIQRFCPRQPHGRKAQSLLECPAKWRLSDAGEVQSQWMRRAESDARHGY